MAFTSAKISLREFEEQQARQQAETEARLRFCSARSAAAQEHQEGKEDGAAGRRLTHYTHSISIQVRGLGYHRQSGALEAAVLIPGARIELLREASNEWDCNAIAVYVVAGSGEETETETEGEGGKKMKMGYVAKESAACLAPFLDDGGPQEGPPVRVESVSLAPKEAEAVAVLLQERGQQREQQREEEEEGSDVFIKPDPDGSPTNTTTANNSRSPSPTTAAAGPRPTSLILQVALTTQREDAYFALSQAFPTPPSSALAAELESEAARREQERVLGVLAAACAKVEKEGRRGLRVLSLFDGIGAALVALLKERVPIALYCSSEIDPDARRVMEARFPPYTATAEAEAEAEGTEEEGEGEPGVQGVLHVALGDVRLIDARLIALLQPDLLVGGSPCQDLSRLNPKGAGLEGPESRLFFEFLRVRDLCLARSSPTGSSSSSSSSPTTGGETTTVAMLLENVVPREEQQLEAMNRFMRLSPLRLNAAEVSAASRDRLYWTNLPVRGGLKATEEEAGAVLEDVLVSGRPASSIPGNVRSDGKAFCVVRTTHRDWNLVDDQMHPAALAAGSRYRPLLPVEEERLMGFDDHYTRVGGALSDAQRHALLGNSFSVPVVRRLLRRLRPVGEAATAAERAAAVEALGLLPLGSAAATKWCSNCSSRVCMCF